MSKVIEIKVPDIGNFKDVDVIDVLVKPGDTVAVEDALITLESDKASMDIPSPAAGTIKELKIAKGDKASEGSLICLMEVAAGSSPLPSPPPQGGREQHITRAGDSASPHPACTA